MRKTIMMTVILLLSLPAFCSFGLAFDSLVLQDFLKPQSFQLNLDMRKSISGDFEIRIPLTLTYSATTWMAEGAVMVCYYPFDNGLYAAVSALGLGYNERSFLITNEVLLGYRQNFGALIVEPEIVFRDPSGTYSDQYASLRGILSSYSTIRARLKIGWLFNTKENRK